MREAGVEALALARAREGRVSARAADDPAAIRVITLLALVHTTLDSLDAWPGISRDPQVRRRFHHVVSVLAGEFSPAAWITRGVGNGARVLDG